MLSKGYRGGRSAVQRERHNAASVWVAKETEVAEGDGRRRRNSSEGGGPSVRQQTKSIIHSPNLVVCTTFSELLLHLFFQGHNTHKAKLGKSSILFEERRAQKRCWIHLVHNVGDIALLLRTQTTKMAMGANLLLNFFEVSLYCWPPFSRRNFQWKSHHLPAWPSLFLCNHISRSYIPNCKRPKGETPWWHDLTTPSSTSPFEAITSPILS